MAFLELGWLTCHQKPSAHSQFISHFWKSASVLLFSTKDQSLFVFETTAYLFTYFLFFYCTGWNPEEVFQVTSQTTALRTLALEGDCHPPVKAILFHRRGYEVHWVRKRNWTQVWPWSKTQAQSRSLKRKSVSSYHNWQILLRFILQSCSECGIYKFFRQF